MNAFFTLFVSLIQQMLGFERPLTLTDEHKMCLETLEDTQANVFITGKAGTGKSTIINYFRTTTKKKVIVLAPTGLAALNVRGQTIHSFFRFPPRILKRSEIKRLHSNDIYRNTDTIIIDEASMLRADMLDAIDQFLRINGRDSSMPFGGIQIVLVGDMFQLPPIVSREEQQVYQMLYESPHFFSANVFREADFAVIEFHTIFRQKEQEFIDILNQVREGSASTASLQPINSRIKESGIVSDSHIILCTTNMAVNAINTTKLSLIDHPQFLYAARIEGDFPTEDRTLPVDLELRLKKTARVLFLKNDKAGRWVNGTLGVVSHLSEDAIHVRIDNTGETVEVTPDVWENIKYEYNEDTGDVIARPVGKLTQFPLRLAWAITIHKSQGMSFDTVCLDFRKSPFAHGQTYVALSRVRTLQGLQLTRAIYPNDVLLDPRIIEFYKRI